MPLVFLIGISILVTRLVLDSRLGTGTALYLLIPFAISVMLYFFFKPVASQSRSAKYLKHLWLSSIIFLVTSAFLMEGFLCVLMFMPIYYFVVSVGYFFAWLFDDKSSLKSLSVPSAVLVLAAEGMLPQTTYPRDNTATYVAITSQDIETLKANMAAPIQMPKHRGWFIKLFPLPDKIAAGTLVAGDTHNLHFTYKKWIFGNFHKGEMDVFIAKVDPNHIQTQVTKNTAYLSHYMNIEGTDVHFKPLANGGTEVSLTVKYERLLDPVWYFGPMQKLAAKQSAQYIVNTVIIREGL